MVEVVFLQLQLNDWKFFKAMKCARFEFLKKSAGIDTNDDDIDCLTFFTNVPTTLEH